MTDTILGWEGVASGATPTTTTEPLLFAAVSPGSGGSILGDPTAALDGGMGVTITAGTAAGCVFDESLDGNLKQVLHRPVKLPSVFPASTAVATECVIGQLYGGASGTTTIGRLRLRLNGSAWELTFADTAEHSGQLLIDPDVSALAGTYMAIAAQFDATSATANTNTAKFRTYADPYSTTQHTTEKSFTGLNLGAGLGIFRWREGFVSIQTVAGRKMSYDYGRAKGITGTMDGTSWYGAVPAAGAPVANAGLDTTMERLGSVGLSTTGSTIPSGTTILWSAVHSEGAAVTLSAPTNAACNLSTATPGLVTVTLTLTPLSGPPVTDTKLVYVRAIAGEPWRPRVVTPGTFTTFGTTPSAKAAVSDSDLATGVRSTDTPTGQPFTALMMPAGLGAIKFDEIVRANNGTISSVVQTVYKSDTDATVVDTRTYTPVVGTFSQAPGGPWVLDSAAQAMLTGADDAASLLLRAKLLCVWAPSA